MKRILSIMAVLAAVVLLAGCVGAKIVPAEVELRSVRRIDIVSMEMPPLAIGQAYAATGPASIVHYLPRYNIGLARSVGVLSGIVVLLDLAADSHRRPDYPPPVADDETWQLSAELARRLAARLSADGRQALVLPGMQPIPGVVDRGRTVFMENWMAPIRSWYNDDTPSLRYVDRGHPGAGLVLEVGVSNYEVFANKLLLQVHLKLIDPASGRLLGRARASNFTGLPPMDRAFADDAALFRQSAVRAGETLLQECLRALGLLAF